MNCFIDVKIKINKMLTDKVNICPKNVLDFLETHKNKTFKRKGQSGCANTGRLRGEYLLICTSVTTFISDVQYINQVHKIINEQIGTTFAEKGLRQLIIDYVFVISLPLFK